MIEVITTTNFSVSGTNAILGKQAESSKYLQLLHCYKVDINSHQWGNSFEV